MLAFFTALDLGRMLSREKSYASIPLIHRLHIKPRATNIRIDCFGIV